MRFLAGLIVAGAAEARHRTPTMADRERPVRRRPQR
jgi:hypothetical protein